MISEKNKIIAVLVLAFVLRVTGIGFGLPYLYHQDEPIIANHAMSIGVGGWNTHFFVIPPFTIYFFFILQGIYFIVGKFLGVFNTASDFALAFIRDPSAVYLLGRFFIGIIFGTATVWALWWGAKRFFNEKIAFWAAFFLAILPFHVQHSHYIYADIPLTFAVTLIFFVLLAMSENPSWISYIRFGLLMGWAASIKYTALYFVPVILVAHGVAHRKDSLKGQSFLKLILSGICCVLVFLLFAPFSILDWKHFLQQIFHQGGAEGFVGWTHHAIYSIVGGSGIFFSALSILGLFILARCSRKKMIIACAFIFLYYFVNVYFSQRFARYMLPIMPALALLSAIALQELSQFFKKRRLLGIFIIAALCLELLLPSIYSDALFLKTDTRTECVRWFHDNVKAGSVVVVDNRFFGPHLRVSAQQIREKYNLLDGSEKDGARKARLDLMLQALEGEKTYDVYQMAFTDEQKSGAFLFLRPYVDADWGALKKIGAQYLIVNYADPEPGSKNLINAISDKLELARSFSPYLDPVKKTSKDRNASTAAEHLAPELFSRRFSGPYLEIYRIKEAS